MKRTITLYLATVAVLVPLDILFLGVVAKSFFVAEVGDMLGTVRPLPAVLFYLLYAAGVVVFVSGAANGVATTLQRGALFGLFCYATFDLTALALLRHWSWPVAVLDIGWGMVATALSSSASVLVANALTSRN
ncbi:DUF2177 family protein [Bradyrhizobium sp. U87765 SZCCT0131]|uniref:DUF2177 family protein n=1 Tax=unclassified Bradyrhizobium TaxID=2631580 RepID=UPI001BA5CBB0|nr:MULTISPECIES: DUF2177 family protein [unclassified Bradyrhizobium]MBR1223179.1 DUF2177 family protein [Bradyrhizobium sp. U87765 SZCCT0131]MBR1265757.1 DUF2177 family protein [Bradyrhizobium sp. U87765 SZCCT0134]MBR1309272.1 DUF2177 family protein [Bradyrhizobium sp. U87765 SZCCT0110]MBR1323149.1 DUF2177 family protein [Bradyrhizobium sp. U87765 SZCCT0109]MBR1350930.1 DUF2177 family protein [Bradyrhizobium sp. U87765 SZCCT0048]